MLSALPEGVQGAGSEGPHPGRRTTQKLSHGVNVNQILRTGLVLLTVPKAEFP